MEWLHYSNQLVEVHKCHRVNPNFSYPKGFATASPPDIYISLLGLHLIHSVTSEVVSLCIVVTFFFLFLSLSLPA